VHGTNAITNIIISIFKYNDFQQCYTFCKKMAYIRLTIHKICWIPVLFLPHQQVALLPSWN